MEMIPSRQLCAENGATGNGLKKRKRGIRDSKYRKLFYEEFYSKEKQRNGMVARGECDRKVCYCFKVRLLGLLWWLSSKESTCNTGDAGNAGVIPGSGRSLGEGMGTHSRILAGKIP